MFVQNLKYKVESNVHHIPILRQFLFWWKTLNYKLAMISWCQIMHYNVRVVHSFVRDCLKFFYDLFLFCFSFTKKNKLFFVLS